MTDTTRADLVSELHEYAKDWRDRAASKEIVDRAAAMLEADGKRIAELEDRTTLHAVISDIREKSGLGGRPMLSELAAAIGERIAELEEERTALSLDLEKVQTELDEAERALAEERERHQWRTIDSAPHNTRVILVWRDWRDGAWCMEIGPATTGQRFDNGYSNLSQHGSATHWQPLPGASAIRAGKEATPSPTGTGDE